MSISPTPSKPHLSPTDSMLTATLLVAPVLYLVADSTYAARGWDDSIAGVLHVLGAVAYGFVIVRIVAWLPAKSWLAALILLTGLIGMAGNVAYGFDTIHMSLGDTALVHQPGAANLIKPLGLFFPLSIALVGVGLYRLSRRWEGVVVLVAAIGWPIAHIGNIAPLAVAVNVLLVISLGAAWWWHRRTREPESGATIGV